MQDSHRELADLLQASLGKAEGAFLALDTDGLERVADGSAHQATMARIAGLADRLEAQGSAGQRAASLLRLSLVTPTGVHPWYRDRKTGAPVLLHWGRIAPGQALPKGADPAARDKAASPPPGAPQAAAKGAMSSSAGTGVAGKPAARGGRGAVLWVVPVLLLGLTAWLGLQALEPLPPEEVVITPPAPEADNPVPALEARLANLQDAVRDAGAAQDRFANACVIPEPEPEPEPPTDQTQVIDPPAPPPEEPTVVEVPTPQTKPEPEPEPEQGPVVPPVALEKPTPPPEPDPPPVAEAPTRPPVTAPPPTPTPQPVQSACQPNWPPGRTPRMLFVVDGSGSMRDPIAGASSRMDASKRSIRRVVQGLHKDIRIGLISFSDCGDTKHSPYYSYDQRGQLIGKVDTLSPSRATSLAASIARGGAMASSRAPSVLVVVSDGEDTCGANPCAAARAAKAAKPNLTINVIDLSDGNSGGVLQCIASAGGGRVFTPQSASQMNQAAQAATGQPDASGCP
ncbi:MAG: VWA domain-containing protein [Rhodospirillaceae bacterium]